MIELKKFGDESKFAIAIAWAGDADRRERTPMHGGSSFGALQIHVGGQCLTLVQQAGRYRDTVRWYLLPVFEWLAENWSALLHEQNFVWREPIAASAADATFFALRRLAAATSDEDCAAYETVQGWWNRHALRASDSSALYPDLYLRRLGDDIEISWTARQPSFSPDGFHFDTRPGFCLLPVADVAQPLWEVLHWVTETMPTVTPTDKEDKHRLFEVVERLSHAQNKELEARFLTAHLVNLVDRNRARLNIPDRSVRLGALPVLEHFDSPVFMFGGVTPDIQAKDVEMLLEFLVASEGADSEAIKRLVDLDVGLPVSEPHIEGYEMAEALLEELRLPGQESFVDIRRTLDRLNVRVVEASLTTNTVRGVAVAGVGKIPSILVNLTSGFNVSEEGRRFTLAHELFHILFDRSRAKRVAHSSTPWAPAVIEKRANAFAAMFLMPRELISKLLGNPSFEEVRNAAQIMRVGRSALVEHLFNTGRIDEAHRQVLRSSYEH